MDIRQHSLQGAPGIAFTGPGNPGSFRARLLVSPEGQVLFSDRPLADLCALVDIRGKISSRRALHLLHWVQAGYVSESSSVRIPGVIPECGDRLEVTVRPTRVTDVYILQAVADPADRQPPGGENGQRAHDAGR